MNISSRRDQDWQARADLETLLEAERIKVDPKRLAAARKCAKCRKEELTKDLSSMVSLEEKQK